jgi:hypothetical protein
MVVGSATDLGDDFRPDFVVCAADTPPGKIVRWTAAWAGGHGAGFISCGVGINRGHWGPVVLPGVTPCLRCARPEVAGDAADDRPAALAVSFGPVNSMVAAGVSADALWAIAGVRPVAELATTKVLNLTRPSLDVLAPGAVAGPCADPLCAALEERIR